MKEYRNPVDNADYWEALTDAGKRIYEKYKTEFAKQQAMSVMEELERVYKKQAGNVAQRAP